VKHLGWAITAATLIGTVGPSFAADLPMKALPPPVPVFTWTGCYVGANGGYGWGHNHSNLASSSDSASLGFFNPAITAGALPTAYAYTAQGGLAGGQVGCNQQTGNIVVGMETDLDWARVNGSQSLNTSGVAGFVPGAFSSGSQLQWLGTLRGRIGFTPSDHWLVYGTGGIAYGGVNYNTSVAFPTTNDFQNISSTHTELGWTIGAGVEWAFTDAWSFKAEYLYIDLGPRNLITTGSGRAPNPTVSLTDGFSNVYQVVKVGVNYKFNWAAPVVAKY
jgi:outer membrane immunogenic protein